MNQIDISVLASKDTLAQGAQQDGVAPRRQSASSNTGEEAKCLRVNGIPVRLLG